MPAEVFNIEEIRSRRLEDARKRAARRFWAANGEEIHLAFERMMCPDDAGQRVLVARLAAHWEALSLRARMGEKIAAAGSGGTALPPAA